MVRPRTPLLSRERIVEVAFTVIDAEGLDALSTRRLARELGVQAPSLYNHSAAKGEVGHAIGDTVVAAVDLSMLGRDPWPAALRAWARAYRAAFRAHPNVVPFLARGPARRPSSLRLADAVYGALVEAGWPPAQATRIGAAMRYFVAGSALGSFALGFVHAPARYPADSPRRRDAHRLGGRHSQVDDSAFELGLDALIDGLERKFT